MAMHSTGLILNILTIIVILRLKARSRAHKLMAILALADTGSCLSTYFSIPKMFPIVKCTENIWLGLCTSYIIYHESMIAIGAYVYLMLTIDRSVALIWAVQYKIIMTKNKYKIYTIFLFLHHILFMFVAYTFFPNESQSAKDNSGESIFLDPPLYIIDSRYCNSQYLITPIARYYMLAFVTLLVIINIGFCIMLVVYLCITKRRRKSLTGEGSGADNLSKATNTLIFVSALYAVLYIQLMVVSIELSGYENSDLVRGIRFAADNIFTLQNVINPLIYYVRMPEFRKGFNQLLACKTQS